MSLFEAEKLSVYLWQHSCSPASPEDFYLLQIFRKENLESLHQSPSVISNHMISSPSAFFIYGAFYPTEEKKCLSVQLRWDEGDYDGQLEAASAALRSVVAKRDHGVSAVDFDTMRLFDCKKSNTFEVIETQPFHSFTNDETAVNLVERIKSSYNDAVMFRSNIANENSIRHGFSAKMFQHFINNIASYPSTRYLEVGIYNGSSLTAVLENNNDVTALAIDSFDPSFHLTNLGMKEEVLAAVSDHVNRGQLKVVISDCWDVSLPVITDFYNGRTADVYFYDAGHEYADHFMSLTKFITVTDKTFIFMVDDWNWPNVKRGTYDAIRTLQLDIVYAMEVVTGDNHPYWHNGVGVFVMHRKW